MKKIIVGAMTLLLAVSCTACGQSIKNDTKKNITVSAASSLKGALSDVQSEFEKEKGIKVTFNFESSGNLQKQIEEGAPVDVFISAAQKQMNKLQDKSLIEKDSRKNILANDLVLIVSNQYKDKIKNISDITNNDVKISIGTPESVPAGEYAKQSMIYLKIWDKLQDKMVYAKNVSQVATYVERGEVAAGVVYKSDVTGLKNVNIVQVFEENTHKSIVYPSAVISASKDKESAKVFLDYISSDLVAIKTFEKYGFKAHSSK